MKHELGDKTVSEALDFFGNYNPENLEEEKEHKHRNGVKRRHSAINNSKTEKEEISRKERKEKKKKKKKSMKGIKTKQIKQQRSASSCQL